MFGYVNINKPELKVKEFYVYKAYYCGLCKLLKNKYGSFGQMTLSYDMTFLIVLLSSLYESVTTHEKQHCIVHPVRKQDTLITDITEYVADMNIVLTYYHLLDDWEDERKLTGLTGAGVLKKKHKKLEKKYPRQCRVIEDCLNRLKECEQKKEEDLDKVARCFGELMAEIFIYRKDMWEEPLRRMGFYLGKFIYLLDAYDDINKDIKHDSYNPLLSMYQAESFEKDCKNLLTMMMARCSSEFEKLPCLVDENILRNILYEGVWTKYNKIHDERLKRKEQKNDSKSI